MPELDRDTAREWIERWDRQQEESLPDREDRFTALIDAVEEGTGRPDPLVLDIGCGPGSLAVRLLDPAAARHGHRHRRRSGVDDPGPGRLRGVPGLRFADLDLRVPGWRGAAGPGPGAGRRGEHHRAALAARARAARHVRRAGLRAAARRPAARRRPLHPGRQGIPGPGPPGPGAAPARGPAALPRRAPRELARLVGRGGRRSGAGRPRRRTGAPPGGGRSPRSESALLATHVEALRAAASPRSARSGSAATTACLCGVLPYLAAGAAISRGCRVMSPRVKAASVADAAAVDGESFR